MSAGILIDTYTWFEIFKNSVWGNRALTMLERSSPLFISVLTLYELQYRLEDEYGHEVANTRIKTILSYTKTIPVDDQIASLAGLIKLEQKRKKSKMGAVDCLILATARIHHLHVLTGDIHFDGLDETIVL